MAERDTNADLLHELTPEVERLLEHHQDNARIWYTHELVPYSLGRNYQPGDLWCPEEFPLDDAVRSALYVNLLTEDNLPYYYETINSWAPDHDHPWSEWARQWTAEEDRHSTVIREWIHVTRALDPQQLDDGRAVQIKSGQIPRHTSLADLLAYTSLQELATRVAHSNTGRMLDKESGGKAVMAHVAGDEALHHEFYRELAVAAFEVDPSAMMISAYQQIRHFDMPGTGIPGFQEHARRIAKAGIYDLRKFKERVVEPTLARWDVESLTGLTDEAELARDGLSKHLIRLDKVIARIERNAA